jgi:hypothetical protein
MENHEENKDDSQIPPLFYTYCDIWLISFLFFMVTNEAIWHIQFGILAFSLNSKSMKMFLQY